jgi:hypothetical protein
MDSKETDTVERVGVVASDEPATAIESAKARLNVIQRMAAIRDECDAIGKQDIRMEKDGKSWTIKGHTVEAVLSEIRPLFSKHGVGITPNLIDRAFRGNACDVIVEWRFNALDDTSDVDTVRWGGTGTDNGDKAFSKAGTNCLKEMLKKVFLVSDRDDAKEEEDKVEHKPEGAGNTADLERAKAATGAAIEQWAKTFKSALETAPTAKDVSRLQAENAQQLSDVSLPAVTRQFFFDLIQKRKGELS